MKKRKLIFILIISLTAVLTSCGKKPQEVSADQAKEIFNNKYNFSLPESAKIIKYTNDNINNFIAKISIEQKDIEYLNSEFIKYFTLEWLPKKDVTDPNYMGFIYTEEEIIRLTEIIDWLDFEYSNIETCYLNYIKGEKLPDGSYPKTVKNRAFICKNDNGEYYLYIVIY